MPQKSNILATWSETGAVNIWDVSHQIKALNQPTELKGKDKPIYSFTGHPQEGYAVDWSPVVEGRLATGDCTKYIYVWNPSDGKWEVDLAPYTGHTDSVEDIQWSPTEAGVGLPPTYIIIITIIIIIMHIIIITLCTSSE
jgi:ribosome assembly protein RRB1